MFKIQKELYWPTLFRFFQTYAGVSKKIATSLLVSVYCGKNKIYKTCLTGLCELGIRPNFVVFQFSKISSPP